MSTLKKINTRIKLEIKKKLGIKTGIHLLELDPASRGINNVFNRVMELKPRVTHPSEFITLATLAAITKYNIIEVGCYLGYSTCMMASVISGDRKITAIDLFDREKGWSNGSSDDYIFKDHSQLDWALKLTRELGFKDVITFQKNDSLAAYQNLSKNLKNPVDLIFIDAEHSYEGCLNDLNNYAKLLQVNGFLVAHDYICIQHPGVKKAVDEFLSMNKNFSSLYVVHSMLIMRKERE